MASRAVLLMPTYSQRNFARTRDRKFVQFESEDDMLNSMKPTLVRGKEKGVLDSLLIAMRNKDPSVAVVESRYRYKGTVLGQVVLNILVESFKVKIAQTITRHINIGR